MEPVKVEIWKIYKVYCTECEEVTDWCDTKKEAEYCVRQHKIAYHNALPWTLPILAEAN